MEQYKNILVSALFNLGDVVLTTSAVALLKEQYPQAKITIMVRPMAADIVRNHPAIDEVIVYAYKSKQTSFAETWRFAQGLRARKFDIMISIDSKVRSGMLAFLAGIPERIGYYDQERKVSFFTKQLFTKLISVTHDANLTHQSKTYQAVVRGITGQTAVYKPQIAPSTDEYRQKAEALLQALPAGEKNIALCVKGTFALKNWPQEYFAELVDRLAAKYEARFYIIGAPEDKEYAAQVIAKAVTPIANLCGQTNLLELVALLEKTDLFISVDTGAMHIGATTNIPLVAIFGCTAARRWSPLSERVVLLSRNLSCCPCSVREHECPYEHRCVREIGVDVVEENIDALVKW